MSDFPLPILLTLGLLGLCAVGQDLGDGKLGNVSEPYVPTPMCIQSDNSYKPCQQ